MTKESISLTLKKLREQQRLSVKEVQETLLARGIAVSNKTIYGWESGNRLPDADTFLTLCDIYHSEDVLQDFGYRTVPAHLEVVAAHERTDIEITDEMKSHDDALMDDDNF